MLRKQVPKGGFLIESMRDFRHSISARSASIPSSIEENEEVLLEFSKYEFA